jgi:hypothetical protein
VESGADSVSTIQRADDVEKGNKMGCRRMLTSPEWVSSERNEGRRAIKQREKCAEIIEMFRDDL